MTEELCGRTVVAPDGRVTADGNLKELYRRLRRMLLLAASGNVPSFYFDPTTDTYWEHQQYEDGQETLRKVTRGWIEANWPSVKLDKRLVVDWPPED